MNNERNLFDTTWKRKKRIRCDDLRILSVLPCYHLHKKLLTIWCALEAGSRILDDIKAGRPSLVSLKPNYNPQLQGLRMLMKDSNGKLDMTMQISSR